MPYFLSDIVEKERNRAYGVYSRAVGDEGETDSGGNTRKTEKRGGKNRERMKKVDGSPRPGEGHRIRIKRIRMWNI